MKNKFWMEIGWDQEEKLGDAVVALALSKRPKIKKKAGRAAAGKGKS
jgi:hypothetical protein